MPQEVSSSEQEPDDSEADFVEVDPSGRYGRYKEVLGKGAFKKVYRAFDELEGIEVAWNQVKLADLLRNSEDLERLYSEVNLLKTLKHKNIIKFYSSWVDAKNESINFITEIFTSGTLRQYRQKHKHVDVKALKKWSRQILEGLSYLHSHDPPVIHRDLKCDNLFVNGNQGEVKIGDLGLAAILRQARSAHSVIGTPEFMAPELYEEEYNELVDIYAFGMCLLELVTFEYPYVECTNAAQIYKKVTSGIKPASLAKVKDPAVKAFIEKCIAKVSDRLPAKELLVDPFLQSDEDNGSKGQSLQPNPGHADYNGDQFAISKTPKDNVPDGNRDVTVQGQRKYLNTIFLKLQIADSEGHIRNIHFPFDVEVDTTTAVASEMVEELDLTDQDVSTIAAMIEAKIRSCIPDWVPRELFGDHVDNEVAIADSCGSEAQDDASPSTNGSARSAGLVLERLPSGRKYWCDSPRAGGGSSPFRLGPSKLLQTDSVTLGDSWTEENDQSPDSSIDGCNSSAAASDLKNECMHDGIVEEEESSVPTDSVFCETDGSVNLDSSNGPHPFEGNNRALRDIGSDDVRIIVEKLRNIFVEQRKELDELKRKHELAVSDLLRQLPPEVHHRVHNICSCKTSGLKVPCKTGYSTGNCTDPGSPFWITLRDFHVASESGKPESVVNKRIVGPVFRYRFNTAKRNTKSGMGIAVILKDDAAES